MEKGPARDAAAAGQQSQTLSGAGDPGVHVRKGGEPRAAEPRETASRGPAVHGMDFPRYFTLPGVDPFDEVEWENRSAVIGNEKGKVVFEQRDVEIPGFWSQQ